MEKNEKLIVTLIENIENNPNNIVFNWIADSPEDATDIIEKTMEEKKEYYKKNGYDLPVRVECVNCDGCICRYHILWAHYEWHVTTIEDKTKNFFWNCND